MSALRSEFLFTLHSRLAPQQSLDVGQAQFGHRRIVVGAGGEFSGPKLKGVIHPGGADWIVKRADGASQVDARIALETSDGAIIYMSYPGTFDVAPEVYQRMLKGEDVDPSEYYFRTTPVFETGAEQYRWLNRLVCVGIGARIPAGVRYDVFAIL